MLSVHLLKFIALIIYLITVIKFYNKIQVCNNNNLKNVDLEREKYRQHKTVSIYFARRVFCEIKNLNCWVHALIFSKHWRQNIQINWTLKFTILQWYANPYNYFYHKFWFKFSKNSKLTLNLYQLCDFFIREIMSRKCG